MKLKYEFIITEIGDDMIAVPTGDGADQFHGTVRLNGAAAEAFELLQEETTPMAVHEELLRRHPEADRNEVGHALADFLTKLSAEGLLSD
mgnify:CR=1 FL=1